MDRKKERNSNENEADRYQNRYNISEEEMDIRDENKNKKRIICQNYMINR